MLFLIGALRAIVEMLGLCLLGQGVLFLLAGSKSGDNPIFRGFALITRGPLQLTARLLSKRCGPKVVGLVCLFLLFFIWISLALLRLFI
jgi:hypothetical protein